MASWPPSSEPIAQGEPTSHGAGSRVLLGPLRLTRPIGWIGRQVHHVEAEAGDVVQVLGRVGERAVPGRSAGAARSPASCAPIERGKNSYQAPNSARWRSTQHVVTLGAGDQLSHRVHVEQRWTRSLRASSARSSAGVVVAQSGGRLVEQGRVVGVRGVRSRRSRSAASFWASLAATCSSSRAPTSRSLASSSGPCPASSLTVTAWCHVDSGSLQRLDREAPAGRARPGPRPRANGPGPERPGSSGRIGAVPVRVGLHRTLAATASWPSRYTVAETGMRSPVTARAENSPPATTGATSDSPMRPSTAGPYRSEPRPRKQGVRRRCRTDPAGNSCKPFRPR